MDERPPRRRGNAFYVENARNALGLNRAELHTLADVPLPLVHTAFGLAVCAGVFAFRAEVAGVRGAAVACAVLAAVTALALVLYDRLVHGRDLRHALAATALPVAALGAFGVVLAGTTEVVFGVVAGALAALVIGGVPHLGGLRAAGREGTATRLVRDGAGILVLAPLLLGAVSGALPRGAAAALAGAGVALVSADALLTERLRGRTAVAGAVVIGGIFAAAMWVISTAKPAGVRAGLLLVLWYGLRGLVAALLVRDRRRGPVVESALFVTVAVVAIAVTTATR